MGNMLYNCLIGVCLVQLYFLEHNATTEIVHCKQYPSPLPINLKTIVVIQGKCFLFVETGEKSAFQYLKIVLLRNEM